jgi:hypothetical protein
MQTLAILLKMINIIRIVRNNHGKVLSEVTDQQKSLPS